MNNKIIKLFNFKNNCFLNCALQFLLNNNEINNDLIHILTQYIENNNNDDNVIFVNDIVKLKYDVSLQNQMLLHSKIINRFFQNERESNQQDIHETLLYILNHIQDLSQKYLKKKSIYTGILLSQLKCEKCESIKSYDENFFILDIPIDDEFKTVKGSFSKFLDCEIVVNNCDTCNLKTNF